MNRIVITGVTATPPIDVYMADYYGNYQTYLATITGTTSVPVPPEVEYYPPAFFDSITSIMLILVDANGCEKFKILDCTLEEIIAIRTELYIALTTESGEILVPEFVL